MSGSSVKFSCIFTVIVVAMVVIAPGCRNRGDAVNASIRVKVSSSKGETIYLERVTLEGPVTVDSAKADQQGEVHFGVHVDDFDFFMIKSREGDRILLLLEKSEEAEVFTSAGKFGKDYSVSGSGGSSLLLDLEIRRYSDDNVAKKAVFDSIAIDILAAHKAFLVGFLERYPGSPACIIAMYQMIKPGEPLFTYEEDFPLFRTLSESLQKRHPANHHVRDFARRTREYQEEREAWQQREEMLQAGAIPPPVDLFNTQGEKVSLNDFSGKIVLIYFWDARKKESWETNAKLIPLYQQYRYKGFEILGIYIGTDRQLLYNAVKVDGLPWKHLFGNSVVEKQYNVETVPSMLLVDREGRVIHRTITVEQLWQKLPWLLPGSGAEAATVTHQSETTEK
jgi:peroxiredoxin